MAGKKPRPPGASRPSCRRRPPTRPAPACLPIRSSAGVLEHREAIDERIKGYAKNWDFHRIAAVDRNIMRLAIFEMFHREDIPPVVSINEAVDIAKKFSTQDSGKFVNGILDKIKGELMPGRQASPVVTHEVCRPPSAQPFSDGTFSPEELAGTPQRLGSRRMA